MSKLVLGVTLFRALPVWPTSTTSAEVAGLLGLTVRRAQRHLRKLEDAGIAFSDLEPGMGKERPARWWRA